MKTTAYPLVIALLGSSFVPLARPHTAAPPVPGPGGVAAAVQAFLRCQDEGKDSGSLLGGRAHGVEFTIGADGSLQQAEADATPAFLDVTAAGVPFEAADPQAFAKVLAAKVGSDAASGRTLHTEVRRIRANCESERCSLAVVDFDRVYATGKESQRVPMRATVLLRFERSDAGDFRIYHWHASRAAAAGTAAK